MIMVMVMLQYLDMLLVGLIIDATVVGYLVVMLVGYDGGDASWI